MAKNRGLAGSQYLLVVAFIAGASIMSLELCASRVLAPAFGGGMYVWGSLIGVVMVALSIGYYFGGRLADAKGGPTIIYRGFIVSAAVVALVSAFGYFITMSAISLGLMLGPVVSVLLLFAPPMTALSVTSPVAIRFYTKDASEIGASAGLVYAVSTVGSIVGTFLTAFLLVPELGTRNTLLLNAAVLLAFGALGLKKKGFWVPALIVAACFLTPQYSPPGLLFRTESAYNIISVYDDPEYRSLRLNWERYFIQSLMAKGGGNTNKDYFDAYTLAPYINGGKRVLWLGLAGGTSAKELLAYHNVSIDAVEIDPRVVDVSREYFGVRESERLRIHVMDGRQFLRKPGQYDIVDIDVFNGADVPFHMATVEFFEEVNGHLSPGGIVMMNVLTLRGDKGLRDAIGRTMGAVFPSVYYLDLGENSIVIATKDRTSPDDLVGNLASVVPPELLPLAEKFSKGLTVIDSGSGDVFTDDRSNIEELAFDGHRRYFEVLR